MFTTVGARDVKAERLAATSEKAQAEGREQKFCFRSEIVAPAGWISVLPVLLRRRSAGAEPLLLPKLLQR